MRTNTIALPESITIRSAAALREQLIGAFAEQDEILLDADAVAEVDLSFVQLLAAARTEPGKAIRLARPANPAITALLSRAGFLTDPAPADIDFWFHGDLPR